MHNLIMPIQILHESTFLFCRNKGCIVTVIDDDPFFVFKIPPMLCNSEITICLCLGDQFSATLVPPQQMILHNEWALPNNTSAVGSRILKDGPDDALIVKKCQMNEGETIVIHVKGCFGHSNSDGLYLTFGFVEHIDRPAGEDNKAVILLKSCFLTESKTGGFLVIKFAEDEFLISVSNTQSAATLN
jgi:hypothetical protein